MSTTTSENGASTEDAARRAPRWIPFLRLPRGMAWRAYRLAQFASNSFGPKTAILFAIIIGAVPFLLSFVLRCPGHQPVTGLLLAILTLGFALHDRWIYGILAIAAAFAAHSTLVIALSRVDPQRCAPLLPDGEEYWQKQRTWIETGVDPEYQIGNWVPAHLQLLGGTVLYSYTSMGALTFHRGFYEVDLMNYYNARLGQSSHNRPLAFILGWHIWSMLRGLGYLFITFEIVSFSFSRLTGLAVSTVGTRRWRWALGLALLLADGLAKWFLLEPVRSGLHGVLT